MPLVDIINNFNKSTRLPIFAEQVRQAILADGGASRINIFNRTWNFERIVGFCNIKKYGDDKIINIYYRSDLSPEERRVVLVKEMLHVYDKEEHINIDEAILNAVESAQLPRDAATIYINPDDLDGRMLIPALAILVPEHLRNRCRELYDRGELDIDDVTRITGIPRKYKFVILREDFEDNLNDIIRSL